MLNINTHTLWLFVNRPKCNTPSKRWSNCSFVCRRAIFGGLGNTQNRFRSAISFSSKSPRTTITTVLSVSYIALTSRIGFPCSILRANWINVWSKWASKFALLKSRIIKFTASVIYFFDNFMQFIFKFLS